MEIKNKIKEAFKKLTVERGGPGFPVVHLEVIGELEPGTFYNHYPSKRKLTEEIFVEYYAKALDMARQDAVYGDYISRQKLLAFYFSLIEVVKGDKEFIKTMFHLRPVYECTPSYLEPMKSAYMGHIKMLIEEGIAIEEIEARLKISDYYAEPHWYQMMYILDFWTGDDSEAFEKTDEAIEKAVALGYDLMGRNVLDTAFEFGKFWWNNK